MFAPDTFLGKAPPVIGGVGDLEVFGVLAQGAVGIEGFADTGHRLARRPAVLRRRHDLEQQIGHRGSGQVWPGGQ